MIKINVEVNSKSWYIKELKIQKNTLTKKLKKISKIVKFFQREKYNFYHFT